MADYEQITVSGTSIKVRCPESLDECHKRIDELKARYQALVEERKIRLNTGNAQYIKWSGHKLQQMGLELSYLKRWSSSEKVSIGQRLADSGIVAAQELRNGQEVLKKLYWLVKRRQMQKAIVLTRDEKTILAAAEHWLKQQAALGSMAEETEPPQRRRFETDEALELISMGGR